MVTLKVGVLALQGAFHKHIEMLKALKVETKEVRKPSELADCKGLIIPGGESTTIHKHLKENEWVGPIRDFAKSNPIFGTCAGLILIAESLVDEERVVPLKLLDVDVARNAFGRQVDSFSAEILVRLDPKQPRPFHAMFIRAPKIQRAGKQVEVLSEFQGEPILVRQGHHLGATFHPELTDDPTIHAYFLKMIEESR